MLSVSRFGFFELHLLALSLLHVSDDTKCHIYCRANNGDDAGSHSTDQNLEYQIVVCRKIS